LRDAHQPRFERRASSIGPKIFAGCQKNTLNDVLGPVGLWRQTEMNIPSHRVSIARQHFHDSPQIGQPTHPHLGQAHRVCFFTRGPTRNGWFTHLSLRLGTRPQPRGIFGCCWGGCYLGQQGSAARVPSRQKDREKSATGSQFFQRRGTPQKKIIHTVSLITSVGRIVNRVNPLRLRLPFPCTRSVFPSVAQSELPAVKRSRTFRSLPGPRREIASVCQCGSSAKCR